MDAIRALPGLTSENHTQLENVRKMLLAMVEDMRVVIIKLSERTATMRTLAVFDENTRIQFAKETMDIYAPLANRLGIGQLKWELEDRSLRYLEPATYHDIAHYLKENRLERERYIQEFTSTLEKALHQANIKHAEIQGRVKHIYSIYRKMKKKKLPFDGLYDLNAVRILVNSIEDCYTALSIVHGLWQPLPSEFDDYIITPKANGYRSIHTVIVYKNKNVEVQIRTHQMHKESEHGVAAHWRYKEGGAQKASYEAKIAWLRQVLSWQKELTKAGASPDQLQPAVLDDRVYVLTPNGEIVDLPQGSTPLDFAYHIHSEVGHRCRGAKINGHMVTLTHALNTGELVEILTGKHPNPSRDWLNSHLGYLKSARAKAKVHHWFKLQDYDKNLADGHALLEKECQRLAIHAIDYEFISHKLHYKNSKDMLAALGSGDLRLAQILGAIQTQQEPSKSEQEPTPILRAPSKITSSSINIAGVEDLLTHPAKCCKPVPGDPIVGYVTQGRGIAIHRKDCPNILQLTPANQGRLFEVNWGQHATDVYPVDIVVHAYDRPGLVRDVTTLIANEKLNLLALTTTTNKTENYALINLTIEINSLASLSKILDKIKQVPNVFEVARIEKN
jgi:GTP pyrophosphokinase